MQEHNNINKHLIIITDFYNRFYSLLRNSILE